MVHIFTYYMRFLTRAYCMHVFTCLHVFVSVLEQVRVGLYTLMYYNYI